MFQRRLYLESVPHDVDIDVGPHHDERHGKKEGEYNGDDLTLGLAGSCHHQLQLLPNPQRVPVFCFAVEPEHSNVSQIIKFLTMF